MIALAINGFGRIGRTFLRVLLSDPTIHKNIKIVALNLGPADPKDVAYATAYDSLMGPLGHPVTYINGMLEVDGHRIQVLTERDPAKLPWKQLKIDWVVEASGKFTTRVGAQLHLQAGAQRILITAPATDEDVSIIPGVNDAAYKHNQHTIISLGSCTTNALAPLLHVLHKEVGITQAEFTTIHAYTNSQALLDVENKHTRLSRAAAINMIPSNTGANKVIGKIIPDLAGSIVGHAIRVPVTKVSIIDLCAQLKKSLTDTQVNDLFIQAQNSYLKNILSVTNEPLVSCDFFGNPHSVIVDSLLTKTQGTSVKVFGWYDNEWGYSVRLKDFLVQHA